MVTGLCTAILVGGFVLAMRKTSSPETAAGEDPHRPPCTDAHCRKIKSFPKAHYCGEPYDGNGQDGCFFAASIKPSTGIAVIAGFDSEWSNGEMQFHQHGQPSDEVRGILIGELRKLGLPGGEDARTYFTVWKSNSAAWSLAEAYHYRQIGDA